MRRTDLSFHLCPIFTVIDLPSVLVNGTVGSQPVCCEIVSRRMIIRMKMNVRLKELHNYESCTVTFNVSMHILQPGRVLA